VREHFQSIIQVSESNRGFAESHQWRPGNAIHHETSNKVCMSDSEYRRQSHGLKPPICFFLLTILASPTADTIFLPVILSSIPSKCVNTLFREPLPYANEFIQFQGFIFSVDLFGHREDVIPILLFHCV